MPPQQREDRYQPLALIGVTMVALLGFAVFFLSFLVAPLAILLIFYVGFAASDRSRRRRNASASAHANANAAPVAEPPGEPVAAVPPAERHRAATLLAREAQYRRNTIERPDDPEPPTPR
ncbi:hypothetical protein [Capillimicrobium parvum]|uniref:Uncharacterized protein n=1 Tax=Capillimicrobium parvum TaxID=2884022 RepID=A0A9E6Y369_9ACTN|nr:hypothetical protein [Capillimicrobium parvum]UGS38891.1 hypothetical protein DSM104329_05322 [Capillimicrobium parvum]